MTPIQMTKNIPTTLSAVSMAGGTVIVGSWVFQQFGFQAPPEDVSIAAATVLTGVYHWLAAAVSATYHRHDGEQ